MPIIQIDAVEGRTLEQKRALVKAFTDSMVKIYETPPESVTIIIRESSKQGFAKSGVLLSDK